MVDLGANFKSIQRRVHNIQYKQTKMATGYEDTEEKYRKMRDIIDVYRSNLKNFMNYEHGGKTLKTIKDGITTLSRKWRDDYFLNDSIYQQGATALEAMSASLGNGDMSRKYADTMREIEKAKNTFNDSLEEAVVAIQRFERDAENIDNKRVEIKNKRYDLEKLMSSPTGKQEVINDTNKKFTDLMQSVLVSMNAFIGSKGVGEIVKNVMKAHYEFHRTCQEKLKPIAS